MRTQAARMSSLLLMLGIGVMPSRAQDLSKRDSTAGAETVEDARDKQVMERFKAVLERAPRRGTSLDRVYGYHVERGSLDALINGYRERVAKTPDDGAAWLLIGLFEAQRGQDAAAVEAFTRAEKTRPNDALPSYYLGQALVLIGRPDTAVEAFERALARKPIRTDLLEIFQALGRVHQRAHRADQALQVWKRLETMFPEDVRVQEQIAATLAEEDQPEQALERYEKLATKVTDRYRQVQLRLEAAALKVRLNKSTEALADFENLLGRLDPESWLAREVRRKVEDVFLRRDDLAGLAKYYESWIAKTPDDVEAMARLGRTLTQLGRADDARAWLDKAVKQAPSRRELRTALIELLRRKEDFAGAAAQYEAMHKADPNDPDVIRDWGRLLLADTKRPEVERRKAASEVWSRLVKEDTKDPVAIAQTADLYRQANLVDEAIALYKKSIEVAPESPQYREYLGEYYHYLKRPTEALAVWRETVAGKRGTAKNLARLGEVLAGFGYRAEALEPLTAAVKLEGDDLDLRLKLADVLLSLDKPREADLQLADAEKLATDPEQFDAVLTRRIKSYQASNSLGARIEELRKSLATRPDDAKALTRLALFLEADGKAAEAAEAAAKATERDPKSIQAWTVSARLHESSGSLKAASDAYQTLATLDRRARTDYLSNIAKLEARLGRRDAAMKAGRDLLAAAPGNPEHDQFFAELCFSLGEQEEGLETLRRSARANPADPKVMLTLAENLARLFRTEEAIELFWRAFEKSTDIEQRLGVVTRLTDQYLQRNQFDRLIARLEREIREPDRQREKSLCLAQAFQASGDFGSARAELEKLLSNNSRDAQLLSQMAGLAEAEGDLATAARYLSQALEYAPSVENTFKLAQLHLRAGQSTEAEAVWMKLGVEGNDAARSHGAIDSLLQSEKYSAALTVTERLLVKSPGDWELVYREGVALAGLGKTAEASRRFESLLELRFGDDEKSAKVKSMTRTPNGPAGARLAQRSGTTPPASRSFPLQERIQQSWQIRRMLRLDGEYYGYSNFTWTAGDFGQARMASLGWLLRAARDTKSDETFLAARYAAAEKPEPDPRRVWEAYYLATLESNGPKTFEIARRLARLLPNETATQWAFLTALRERETTRESRGTESTTSNPSTLPDADLNLALDCFRSLLSRRSGILDGSIASTLDAELRRAKRDADADALYRELLKAPASDSSAIRSAILLAAERADIDNLLPLLDRHADEVLKSKTIAADGLAAQALNIATNKCFEKKKTEGIPRLFNHLLATIQRPEARTARAKSKTYGNPYGNGRSPYYTVSFGGSSQSFLLDYPLPNPYFDYEAIGVLRGLFENYRRADLTSDLIGLARKALDQAPGVEKLYPGLALGYLLWWNEEKDEAIRILTRSAEQTPDDVELKLGLAELLSKRNENREALDLADSVEPRDQRTTERREMLALRLAVLSGDIVRARKASERLFGLRLDSSTQIELSQQMNQLGQPDLADAVLARARRRAGGNTGTLVNLMNQYQHQGKTEASLQLAHQVLRQSGGSVRAFASGGFSTSEDSARNEAIALITRSGKLKDLVERAEAQLKVSPNSVQLLQTLADYYLALKDIEKTKATQQRILTLRSDDSKLRFQFGLQLGRAGDPAGAIEYLKIAIKKEPGLFIQRYWEVQNMFQSAGKLEDLVKLLEESDLGSMKQNPWGLTNVIQTVMQTKSRQELGMRLFRKAWKDLPDIRQDLLGSLHDESIWGLPELYEFAREAIVPPPSVIARNPWAGVDRIMAYGGGGRVYGLLDRLIQAATKQNKVEDLHGIVRAGLARSPDWLGGKAILAILDLRAGRVAEGTKTLSELSKSERSMSTPVRMLIGQALDSVPDALELQISLYEAATNGDSTGMFDEFEYGPARRLLDLYKKANRMAEARAIMVKASGRTSSRGYDPDYEAYQKAQSGLTFARTYLELGYPADAAKAFAETVETADPAAGGANWGNEIRELRRQASTGFEQALNGFSRETTTANLKAMATPRADLPSDAPAVDLILLAHPKSLAKTTVVSLFAEAALGRGSEGTSITETMQAIDKLRKDRPKDLSAAIAALVLVAGERKPGSLKAEADKLAALAASGKLEPLPDGARVNARQRSEAERRLGLWIAARECRKYDETRSVGDELAAEALVAARRLPDKRWILAMLREGGQACLDHGDRAGAEAMWREMTRIVLSNPNAEKTDARKKPDQPNSPPRVSSTSPVEAARTRLVGLSLAQAPAVAPATEKPKTVQSTATSIVTLERFEQAAQIAKLAADNRMFELSFDTIREALAQGPPVKPVAVTQANGRMVIRSGNVGGGMDPVARSVDENLHLLESAWRREKAPPDRVYAALRAVVLPESRSPEIFHYASPVGAGQFEVPRSVADLLAQWAVESGKDAELTLETEKRLTQPSAAIAAKSLLALIAIRKGTEGPAKDRLKALRAEMKSASGQAVVDAVAAVGILGMSKPELADESKVILEEIVRIIAPSDNESASTTLLLKLARHELGMQRDAEAAKLLTEYENILLRDASRYAGDYSTFRRRAVLLMVAHEYLNAGRIDAGLDYLGRFADAPVASSDYGTPNLAVRLRALDDLLDKLTPAQRYEKLKKWALPTSNRSSVRLSIIQGPKDDRPISLRPRTLGDNAYMGPTPRLLEAASVLGKLSELESELRTLVERKIPDADLLLALARIHRGDGTAGPWVEERSKRWGIAPVSEAESPDAGRSPENPVGGGLNDTDSYILHLALTREGTRDTALLLADRVDRRTDQAGNSVFGPRLQFDRIEALRATSKGASGALAPSLRHWFPATPAIDSAARANVPPLWIKSEGIVRHVTASGLDSLCFGMPLTGEFEFSVDILERDGGMGRVGFHGLFLERSSQNAHARVLAMGAGQAGASTLMVHPNAFHKFTIKKSSDETRYLVNNHLLYRERNAGDSFPWLSLAANFTSGAAFRNPRLKGNVVVPSEVRLIAEDRFDGWSPRFQGTRTPRFTTTSDSRIGYRDASTKPDWRVEKGELLGEKLDPEASERPPLRGGVPAILSYARPLRDGETLSYEFRYEPGRFHVSPALDQCVFDLDPEAGVQPKWVADPYAMDDSGFDPARRTEWPLSDPNAKRSTGKLPLKPNDWNHVSLTIRSNLVEIRLNGQEIHTSQLDASNGRFFGFHRNRAVDAVRIRSVSLKGDWPTRIPSGDLFEETTPPTPSIAADLMGDTLTEFMAARLLDDIRAASDEEKYRRLLEWVLPSSTHSKLRLHGRPSADSAGHSSAADSPALELLRLAASLKRTEELAKRIAEVSPKSDDDRSAKLALISVLAADAKRKNEALDELRELAKRHGPRPGPGRIWPELTAAIGCSSEPSLRAKALALLEPFMKPENGPTAQFAARVAGASRLLDVPASEQIATGIRSADAAWIAASIDPPGGSPSSTSRIGWHRSENGWTHVPGREFDRLYLKSPLLGDFEIEFEASTRADREIMVGYGGFAFAVGRDGKTLAHMEYGRSKPNAVPLKAIGAPKTDFLKYKLVSKNGTLSLSVDGVKIQETRLPAEPDPWVTIESPAIGSGTVRALRVSGGAKVPERLQLSARANLNGWFDDLPRTIRPGGKPVWTKSVDEIVARSLVDEKTQGPEFDEYGNRRDPGIEAVKGCRVESVLRYNRPMLESGSIGYEFFFDPGVTEVHPALGHLVFLLSSEGVAIHELSAGSWINSKLTPDNQSVEPSNRRGPAKLPLRPKSWNKLVLRLKENTVTIMLNGETVYERTIEPSNSRDFGLFHYADSTRVRVRNVTYEGDWDRETPAAVRANVPRPAK